MMRFFKVKKSRVMAFITVSVLFIALLSPILQFNLTKPKDVYAATQKFTLGGIAIDISDEYIDGFSLKSGEDTSTTSGLRITEFEIKSPGSANAVYTNKFPYAVTPLRAGATEYVFEWSGNAYKYQGKYSGGKTNIPVNGIVVSAMSDVWASVAIGSLLTKTINFPDYKGAVEIIGTGNYSGAANKNIRIAINKVNGRRDAEQSVYYNSEWGLYPDTNEFGTEILVRLSQDGVFRIEKFRNIRDKKQITIDSTSFVISLHGESLRSLLSQDDFVKIGDTVNLIGMKFVDLNKSASSTLTAKNPTAPIKPTDLDELNNNQPFPGFRAANYLLYYDKDYDKSLNPRSAAFDNFTGCNEWGYEVLVKQLAVNGTKIEGIIVSHDKQISNLLDESEGVSFILSGNGTAENFLKANALNGAAVQLDGNKVTITTTSASYVTTAETRLNTVNNKMQAAIDALYDLNYIGEGDTANDNKWTRASNIAASAIGTENDDKSAESLYGLMKLLAMPGMDSNYNLAKFNNLYLTVINQAFIIESLTFQSPILTSIAAWHRPNIANESNLDGIKNIIKQFKDININSIYVETFWNGYTMNNNSAYVDYHPDFVSCTYDGYSDYLSAFIGEAHKAGIEVHAWVENFFVGYEGYPQSNVITGKLPNSNLPATIDAAAKHQSWIIRDYQNNLYTQFEGGKYLFIDPSNPEVQNFILDYYKEILTKYDFDGINLDYIRYPVQRFYSGTNATPQDHGYSEFSAKKFLAELGYPQSKQNLNQLKKELNKSLNFPEDANLLMEKWIAFKTRQITEYVGKVATLIRSLEAERKQTDNFTVTDIIISTAVFADADVSTTKNQDWLSWIKKGYIDVATPMAYYANANTVQEKIAAMVNKINGITYNYGGIAPYFMGLKAIEQVYHTLSSINAGAFGVVIFDSKSIINNEEVSSLLRNGVFGQPSVVPHATVQELLDATIDTLISRETLYGISGDKKIMFEEKLIDIKNMKKDSAADVKEIIKAVYDLQNNVRKYATGHAVTRIQEELANLNNVLNVKVSRLYVDEGWVPESGERPDLIPGDKEPEPSHPVIDDIKPDSPTLTQIIVIIGGAVLILTAALVFVLKKKK